MLIEIVGKFFDNHSLSIINRNIALELHKQNHRVKITPIDSDVSTQVLVQDLKVLKSLESVSGLVDVQLRHSYPPVWVWPKNVNTKVVYIQPWEFSKTLSEWQYKFETFADALIVPSKNTEAAFLQGGINPNSIFVVPNGYDSTIFNKEPSENRSPHVKNGRINYLFVGNAQWRKGLEILIQAWGNSFKKNDNVNLIIKDSPAIYGENTILEEILRLQYKYNTASINYVKDNLTELEMSALYKSSDALVQPYRGEGFGMHIQEAIASGCIPIIPDQGPTEDFVPKDIGYKIKTTKKFIDSTDPNIFMLKPGDSTSLMSSHTTVNEPEVSSLCEGLRTVYHQQTRQTMQKAVDAVNMENTWAKVANDYAKILRKINENKKVRRFR